MLKNMKISDGKILRVLQDVKKSRAIFCLILVGKVPLSGSNVALKVAMAGGESMEMLYFHLMASL